MAIELTIDNKLIMLYPSNDETSWEFRFTDADGVNYSCDDSWQPLKTCKKIQIDKILEKKQFEFKYENEMWILSVYSDILDDTFIFKLKNTSKVLLEENKKLKKENKKLQKTIRQLTDRLNDYGRLAYARNDHMFDPYQTSQRFGFGSSGGFSLTSNLLENNDRSMSGGFGNPNIKSSGCCGFYTIKNDETINKKLDESENESDESDKSDNETE
jgi:hypothetical protein